MWAIGKVESGGSYTARNPSSGAYGKYQIMPPNWPAWAKTYLGNSKAKQTPANQEKVAKGKFTSLYRSLGSWRRVAYWWLTGSKRTSGWSALCDALRQQGHAPVQGRARARRPQPDAPPKKHYGERHERDRLHGHVEDRGPQRLRGRQGSLLDVEVGHGDLHVHRQGGDLVRPGGPTRGKAKVFVDGKYARTVDFYRARSRRGSPPSG